MEESDKTTALKKAYAEIILNTAKESAARVMVSDRKSTRFQHDLSGTKEEALRLLVRLKHMIDAKTLEADITSSNQQRQIDVLEAQLQEAEDIITDLRSEVRWVRDKLEKAKAYESLEQNVVNKKEETISVQNVDHEVVLESLNPDQEVADTCVYVKNDLLPDCSSLLDVECENEDKHFDELSVDTLKENDVCESESEADIIIKKLELSRNGCTQRVHALERKIMERTPPSSANEVEQRTTEKDSEENLSSGKANGHEAGIVGNKRCLVLALRASSAEVITIPSNSLGTSKSRKLRGRKKKRCGQGKATSVRPQSKLIKPCESQSNVPCSKTSNSDGEGSMETHLSVERKDVDTCKGLEEHLQHLDSGDISIIHKGKMSKNMGDLGGISSPVNPGDHLVEACQGSNLVSTNVEDAENKADIPESETKTKPLPCLNPGLTSSKSNVDPTSGSINGTVVSGKAANGATDKDLTSRKEDVLVRCEGEEESMVPSTKMVSNLVNRATDRDLTSRKITAVVSDQITEPPRDTVNRLLKYTFQRKRKRGSSNVHDDSNNLPGKREVKEKENNKQDPIESTFE